MLHILVYSGSPESEVVPSPVKAASGNSLTGVHRRVEEAAGQRLPEGGGENRDLQYGAGAEISGGVFASVSNAVGVSSLGVCHCGASVLERRHQRTARVTAGLTCPPILNVSGTASPAATPGGTTKFT